MQLIATDNKRVVIGLGMTGLSCARYLASKQLPFSMVDSRDEPPGLAEFKQNYPDVSVTTGEISDQCLEGATELVVSPGVSLEEPAIKKAQQAGAVVCGDIDLFVHEARAPIVAITGSNGKSTVTTLVGEMAVTAGKKVLVGGNIGIPALDLLEHDVPDFYVLELSSFQLERAAPINAEVATVLNISADHMDRYSSLQAYHQAKHRVFFGCRQAVVNRDDNLTKPLVPDEVKQWSFSLGKPEFNGFGLLSEDGVEYLAFRFKPLMAVNELKMVGRHNIENALAALALGHAMGLSHEPMLKTLKTFAGLEHRCQFAGEYGGVRFYNDSKGTNVGAAIASIKGLASSVERVVLIAGGVTKGADFTPLLPSIQQHCRTVVLIGEATNELAALVANQLPVEAVKAATMAEAVQLAYQLAEKGDAVLLSPACASFDMFDDYQHRGEVFCQSVDKLLGRAEHQGGGQ